MICLMDGVDHHLGLGLSDRALIRGEVLDNVRIDFILSHRSRASMCSNNELLGDLNVLRSAKPLA